MSIFSYRVYGLGIRSSLPLPELISGEAPADVLVRLESVDWLPSGTNAEGNYFRLTEDEALLFWNQVGTFLVRGGREIILDPRPGVEKEMLRLLLLGPALAVLLHQRGLLVLHSSAVAMSGGAVAFVGGPGWGKSTTAGALHGRGHGVVADDVVAIDLGSDCLHVFPGCPSLKLWPEAAVSLGEDLEKLPRLHPQLDKRGRSVARGFPKLALPLRRIYVLAEGLSHHIESLQPQEALVEMVRHSYCVRLLENSKLSSHFLQCARLVNRVPVWRLRVRRSLPELSDLAQLVEEDLAQTTC